MATVSIIAYTLSFVLLLPPLPDLKPLSLSDQLVRGALGMTAQLLVWVVPVYFVAWWFGRYRVPVIETAARGDAPPATHGPDVPEPAATTLEPVTADGEFERAAAREAVAAITTNGRPLPKGRLINAMREVTAPKSFYLIVAAGWLRGKPLRISTDLFLVGSDPICQFVDKNLPAQHCAFVTRLGKVFVCDLDGEQSVVVNNVAIPNVSEWALHVGDIVTVGPVSFLVQYRETALSGKDLEEWAARCLDTVEHDLNEEYDFVRARITTASEAAKGIVHYLKSRSGEAFGRLRVVWEDENTLIVRFNDEALVEEGELALVRQELCACAERPGLRLLLDFKNVCRVSTAGLSVLGAVRRQLRHRGCSVAACRVPPGLTEIVPVLEAAEIPCFPDKTGALAGEW